MDFPLVDVVDHDRSRIWLRQHFHPEGLRCLRCEATWREAYRFRRTKSSRLQVWRCKECAQTYTLYSGTVFDGRHLPPAKVAGAPARGCSGQEHVSDGPRVGSEPDDGR
jgi:hypothetical protein